MKTPETNFRFDVCVRFLPHIFLRNPLYDKKAASGRSRFRNTF